MLNDAMHNITDHQFHVVLCSSCHTATATILSQVDLLSIPGFQNWQQETSETEVILLYVDDAEKIIKALRLHNNVQSGMDISYGITLSLSITFRGLSWAGEIRFTIW